jgi:hypothetical protein
VTISAVGRVANTEASFAVGVKPSNAPKPPPATTTPPSVTSPPREAPTQRVSRHEPCVDCHRLGEHPPDAEFGESLRRAQQRRVPLRPPVPGLSGCITRLCLPRRMVEHLLRKGDGHVIDARHIVYSTQETASDVR